MKTLEGKSALVTGAARGIGRAICVKLAAAGADIAGLDIDTSVLGETAALCEAAGAKFVALQADVADFDQVKAAVGETVSSLGSLDILVNNAGITRDNLMMRMSDEDWDLVLRINLKGTFNGIKAASRPMGKQRSGRIVNIASVVGIIGNAGQANYSASKAGVIGLTKTAARELAKRGIGVNAVAPGFIQTAMTEKLTQEARDALATQIPFGRLGQPEDVADAVLFLSGPDAGYITGQVICVDGGMVM
jgi:3-oxoacyl-[acyl-carrier protein] reductase